MIEIRCSFLTQAKQYRRQNCRSHDCSPVHRKYVRLQTFDPFDFQLLRSPISPFQPLHGIMKHRTVSTHLDPINLKKKMNFMYTTTITESFQFRNVKHLQCIADTMTRALIIVPPHCKLYPVPLNL